MNKDIVVQTQKQIIEGHSKDDIIEFISDSGEEEPEKIFAAALIKFSQHGLAEDAIKKGFACAAVQTLYQKMLEVGDFAGALSALKEFSKLNNLYDKEKGNQKKGKRARKDLFIDTSDLF